MKPILVLQMQRMGDLILSFPLLGILQRQYPDNPIYTVAEPGFFSELVEFSPHTVFFAPEAVSKLKDIEFKSVINLSHRQSAAQMAGSMQAEHFFGTRNIDNVNYINGAWALHRASIVHNNRYNLFHWSDLQLLDHAKQGVRAYNHAKTPISSTKGKIGIFVGASENEKRPSAEFFANLAKILLRKHYQPVFLGGIADIEHGQEAERLSGLKNSSLCGKFNLTELARLMRELCLFITPDTGPMHLATWLRTPVLNLSVGHVNPWETGPFFPNHYVLQPKLACNGCWQPCTKIHCHNMLHAGRVALVAQSIIENPSRLENIELTDINLYLTGRDTRNLYDLIPVQKAKPSTRHLLARFWQEWFWHRLNNNELKSSQALEQLNTHYPHLNEQLCKGVINLGYELQKHLKNVYKGKEYVLDAGFWHKLPTTIRPLSGHLHMFLQNENYERKAWSKVLEDIEILSKILR